MNSNAGCFVEVYASCHRPLRCPGNSLWTARFQTIARLFLHCCGLFFIYCGIKSFPPSTKCTLKESVFSNFWIIFIRSYTVIEQTLFFIPYSVRKILEVLQSFWNIVIVLVKKLYKPKSFLQWDSHGKPLGHEMKKSLVHGIYITNETSCDYDMYFNLHIMTLTAPSVAKIRNYFFFLCHTFPRLL